MTTAHVEKFAELVGKDPALLATIGIEKLREDAAAAAASAEAFISNAVLVAKAHGLEFTEDEARDYFAEEFKAQAAGELSDTQLEEVAGGKQAGEDSAAMANYVGSGQAQSDQELVLYIIGTPSYGASRGGGVANRRSAAQGGPSSYGG